MEGGERGGQEGKGEKTSGGEERMRVRCGGMERREGDGGDAEGLEFERRRGDRGGERRG